MLKTGKPEIKINLSIMCGVTNSIYTYIEKPKKKLFRRCESIALKILKEDLKKYNLENRTSRDEPLIVQQQRSHCEIKRVWFCMLTIHKQFRIDVKCKTIGHMMKVIVRKTNTQLNLCEIIHSQARSTAKS